MATTKIPQSRAERYEALKRARKNIDEAMEAYERGEATQEQEWALAAAMNNGMDKRLPKTQRKAVWRQIIDDLKGREEQPKRKLKAEPIGTAQLEGKVPAKAKEPRKARAYERPAKSTVKKAMEASLLGRATEEQKAVLALAGKPTRRNKNTQFTLRELMNEDPYKRERRWVSDALTQCPLPLSEPKGVHRFKVIREVPTGNGTLKVIYTSGGEQPIPYGRDAFLLDVLISEARRLGLREVSFSSAIEIMRNAGFDVGGKDYKLFKGALDRIGDLFIQVKRSEDEDGKRNYRVVEITNDVPSKDDVKKELTGQRRILKYAFRFSEEFYTDFMRFYTVMPHGILEAFAGGATEYAIARWMYRRVTKGLRPCYLPLEEIIREIIPKDLSDPKTEGDSNISRLRTKFEAVYEKLSLNWEDLRKGLIPKHERIKGHKVLVGFTFHGRVESLIPDRDVPSIGKTGIDR